MTEDNNSYPYCPHCGALEDYLCEGQGAYRCRECRKVFEEDEVKDWMKKFTYRKNPNADMDKEYEGHQKIETPDIRISTCTYNGKFSYEFVDKINKVISPSITSQEFCDIMSKRSENNIEVKDEELEFFLNSVNISVMTIHQLMVEMQNKSMLSDRGIAYKNKIYEEYIK